MNILPFYSPFNLDFLYLEFRISYISSFETKFILLPLFQNNLFLSSQILLIKTFSSRTNFLIYIPLLSKKKYPIPHHPKILQVYVQAFPWEQRRRTIVINGTFFPRIVIPAGSISTTTTDFRKYEGARHWTSRWTNPSPIPACGTETPRNQILILR